MSEAPNISEERTELEAKEATLRVVPELGEEAPLDGQQEADDKGDKGEVIYFDDYKKVKAARGDQTKFEALAKEYERLIRRVANTYFITGAEDQDTYQEALIGFYEAVRDYDGRGSSFASFADLCMSRKVIDAVKKAGRFKHSILNRYVSFSQPISKGDSGSELELGDTFAGPATHNPETSIIGAEALQHLTADLSTGLSDMEMGALRLFFQGDSYEEIAQKLGTDSKGVDNALQRIKRKVMQSQKEYDPDFTHKSHKKR